MKRLTSIFLTLALFAFVTACDDDPKKNNNTNNANCGNNIIDEGETCDGTALGTADCTTEGFTGGTLGCLTSCAGFDTTGCTNVTNNTTPGHVGDPCTETEQCVTPEATCYPEVGAGLPSGYCVAECDEEGGCSEDGTLCVSAGSANFCAKTCTLGGTDCRVGYECMDIGDGLGVCWAACSTAAHCPTTGICDSESGYCATPPEVCDNTTDDDFDGDVDCDDEDCASLPACGCAEDTYENHDGGDAYTMDLGSIPSSLDGYICGPANEDWFAITPSISFAGKIQLEFTHEVGDLDLYLNDDAFEELARSWGSTNTEEIEWNFVGGTTYYIMVQGYAGAIGAYTLTVDYRPAELEAVIVANPVNGAPGGTVALEVTLNNVGGMDAPGVTANLTTTDADVTLVDGAATFGDIVMGGNAANTADALSFTIAATHKSNLPVTLTLEVTDTDGGAWSFPVSVPVPYPSLAVADLFINDSLDNNDTYPDPSENVKVEFNASNIGALVATGPINVTVEIDPASTVTDAGLTPNGTECSATDMAAGAVVPCPPLDLAVPAGATVDQTIILNFTFTDGAANTWTEQKTLIIGAPEFESILSTQDPAGDNGNYACDLQDVLYYVDMYGILKIKTTFYSACNITGIHDIYMFDGATMITLTLEDGAKSVWTNASGSWAATTNPASFTITPLSGSSAEMVYSIPVSAIPNLTIAGNSLQIAAAVIASWSEDDYNDYAPNSVDGAISWVTITW